MRCLLHREEGQAVFFKPETESVSKILLSLSWERRQMIGGGGFRLSGTLDIHRPSRLTTDVRRVSALEIFLPSVRTGYFLRGQRNNGTAPKPASPSVPGSGIRTRLIAGIPTRLGEFAMGGPTGLTEYEIRAFVVFLLISLRKGDSGSNPSLNAEEGTGARCRRAGNGVRGTCRINKTPKSSRVISNRPGP